MRKPVPCSLRSFGAPSSAIRYSPFAPLLVTITRMEGASQHSDDADELDGALGQRRVVAEVAGDILCEGSGGEKDRGNSGCHRPAGQVYLRSVPSAHSASG